LPVRQLEHGAPASAPAGAFRIGPQGGAPLVTKSDPARILVVDDEENLRNILVFQLRGEGHEARGLGRGDEALPTALSWKPDLVLLDLMMPGMDGFAVCRALRGHAQTQGLPVIVITARGDAATKLQSLVAGAHDFLVKPYSWEELLLRIQSVLELSRRHQGQRSFTGLPGSAAIEGEITRLMNSEDDFAFLSIDIDHFKRFNENFGYERGDEVLAMLARLLTNAAEEEAGKVRFVGHLGGDDFVVLTSTDAAQRVAERLTQQFDSESRGFFAPRDLERGYFEMVNRSGRREMVPLLALTIAVVDNVRGRELHVRRLADLAAELRRYGKSRPGSIVVTERRR
jgi:PleD family two-component response regulator